MANLIILLVPLFLPKNILIVSQVITTLIYLLWIHFLDRSSDSNTYYSDTRCKYFSPHSFCDQKSKFATNLYPDSNISFMHTNIRSLKRNLENFQTNLLDELDFHFNIIGVTEAKIKTSLKKWILAASNFIALIPSRSIRQMLVNFSGVQFQRTVSKFRKRKRKSLSCVHFLAKKQN